MEDILKTLPSDNDETPLCKNEEALALLGNQIKHTPEPCCSIIRLFYYEKLSMDEIADEVGYRNASTAKAKKSQCMSDLIARVTSALRSAVLMFHLKDVIAMDAANSFDLYLFGNLDNDGRSSLETRIMSDMNLKIEFGRYLDKVGERFLRTRNDATEAFKLFFSDKLSSDDCSILVALLRFKTKWACGIGDYISDAMKGISRSSLISLFDAYLADGLSNSSLRLFDMCLTYNEDFASDFNVYLLTVDGICREVEQDNLDFGVAMKSLSKEHLKDILGMRRVGNRTNRDRINFARGQRFDLSESREELSISAPQYCNSMSVSSCDNDITISEPDVPSSERDTASSEPKKKSLRAWIWVAASIAILAVVISVVLYIERNARYSVDDAIYACAEITPSRSRLMENRLTSVR